MKKENKKKVVTLSAMAALLAVVLGMGGKTYAKYFSDASYEAATATVAKWGLVVNTDDAVNLWGEDYKKTGSATHSTVVTSGDGFTVSSSTDGSAVVAPGTSGNFDIRITGVSEVKAQITVTVKFDYQVYLGSYYPFAWSVGGTEIAKDHEATEVTKTYNVNAGTASINETFNINWKWDFNNGNDAADTVLGKLVSNTPLTTAEQTSFQTAIDADQYSTKVGITVEVEMIQLQA